MHHSDAGSFDPALTPLPFLVQGKGYEISGGSSDLTEKQPKIDVARRVEDDGLFFTRWCLLRSGERRRQDIRR